MNRSQAIKKVDEMYLEINEIVRVLKQRERELDDNRIMILRKLENLLRIVNTGEDYKEGINRLNTEGYRVYANILIRLLAKLRFGGGRSSINLPSVGSYMDRSFIYTKPEPYFTVARPVHSELEQIRDLRESAWNKYYDKNNSNERIIRSLPESGSFVLGSNYLIRFGNAFPTQNEATMEHMDQRRNKPELSTVADIMGFLNDGLKKYNGNAPDGSHVGDTVFAYEKYDALGPINTWSIRFTYQDLVLGGIAYSIFKIDEARIYLQKFKLSNNRREKEAYEKILALFN